MVSSEVLGQSPFQLNYLNTSVPTVSLYADISKWCLLRQYAIRSRPVNIQSRSPSNIGLSRDPCQGPPVWEETCGLPSLTDHKCRARRIQPPVLGGSLANSLKGHSATDSDYPLPGIAEGGGRIFLGGNMLLYTHKHKSSWGGLRDR